MTATLQFKNKDFGEYVDYRLLAVHSELSFTQFVSAIAECCHCNFIASDDYIPIPPVSDLDAHFKTAFTQFNCQGRSEQFAFSSVDKLNVFIINNQTTKFNYRKLPTSTTPSNELLLFPEPVEYTCNALNNKGLYIKKWPYSNVNFFVLIFSRKQHGVDNFVNFLFQKQDFSMGNMTEYLYGKQKNKDGEWVQKNSLSEPVKFLRTLFNFAEQRIKNHFENETTNFIGRPSPLSNNILKINKIKVNN